MLGAAVGVAVGWTAMLALAVREFRLIAAPASPLDRRASGLDDALLIAAPASPLDRRASALAAGAHPEQHVLPGPGSRACGRRVWRPGRGCGRAGGWTSACGSGSPNGSSGLGERQGSGQRVRCRLFDGNRRRHGDRNRRCDDDRLVERQLGGPGDLSQRRLEVGIDQFAGPPRRSRWTVPPCAPGENRKWGRHSSESPACQPHPGSSSGRPRCATRPISWWALVVQPAVGQGGG